MQVDWEIRRDTIWFYLTAAISLTVLTVSMGFIVPSNGKQRDGKGVGEKETAAESNIFLES